MDWTAIILSIVTIVPLLLKQHFNHLAATKKQLDLNNLITDKDKKQDLEAIGLKSDMEELNKKINVIYNYVDKVEYRTQLSNKIRKTCDDNIEANSLDNLELLALLNNIKNQYNKVIGNIINTDIKELEVKYIRADINTFAKYIKSITDFTKIDVCEKSNFYEKLYAEVMFPQSEIFIARIEEEVLTNANKYNGTFEKITVNVINKLITNTIKIYRDCKNKDYDKL